jgi:hypothetical protein
MNTDYRDPVSRGLDELAGLADHVAAADRMASITGKARTYRRRKVGAGIAGLAVIAAGTVGAVQLLPGDGSSAGPGFATDPSTPPETSGLTIDLTVEPVGPKEVSVVYRIHGTSHAWSSPDDHTPMDDAGPAYTSIKVDGKDVGGSDGGAIECRPGSPEIPFDETWTEPMGSVPVSGPGTYTITVEAPYCGADGKVVPNEVSTSVVVLAPAGDAS